MTSELPYHTFVVHTENEPRTNTNVVHFVYEKILFEKEAIYIQSI